MAIVSNNLALQGLSGMFGRKMVFRQVFGRTIVAVAPAPPAGPGSAGQQKCRNGFRDASRYAKAILLNPEYKALYASIAKPRHLTAYNAAVSDYLTPPQIHGIDASGYRGHTGDAIRIYATDNVKVTAVEVSITAPDGTRIEAGSALLQPGQAYWQYQATAHRAGLPGTRITVTASDLPGNRVTAGYIL